MLKNFFKKLFGLERDKIISTIAIEKDNDLEELLLESGYTFIDNFIIGGNDQALNDNNKYITFKVGMNGEKKYYIKAPNKKDGRLQFKDGRSEEFVTISDLNSLLNNRKSLMFKGEVLKNDSTMYEISVKDYLKPYEYDVVRSSHIIDKESFIRIEESTFYLKKGIYQATKKFQVVGIIPDSMKDEEPKYIGLLSQSSFTINKGEIYENSNSQYVNILSTKKTLDVHNLFIENTDNVLEYLDVRTDCELNFFFRTLLNSEYKYEKDENFKLFSKLRFSLELSFVKLD
jgi:hypothetical protein